MTTQLREALTAAGAAALIQKFIDPLLLEYTRRYSPVLRSLPTHKMTSTVYNFNARTQYAAGGFVTDGGARPVTNSTYVQSDFKVRLLQTVGAITGFAEEVTSDLVGSLLRREIEGSVQGQLWDTETGILWGNEGCSQNGPYPQFSGLDSQVATFSGSTQNAIDGAGAALSLSLLDQTIDMVETNAAMAVSSSDWMFVASPTAISKLAQLFTNQQRFLDKVEVATGLNVPSYRDIPLVKSSFLGTRGAKMGTVTTATATTGGTLAAATYYYRVAAVMARAGETEACTEVSQATTGSTSTVTLSFSTPTGYEGATPILYKVYRSTATTTETLLGYVDATVVLQADGVTPVATTSIVDTGTALVPMNSSTAPTTLPTAYYGTNIGAKPRGAGAETIYLMSRNRDFVVRPVIRDLKPIQVYPTTSSPDSLPYAIVSDTCLAVRAPRYLGRLDRVVASL